MEFQSTEVEVSINNFIVHILLIKQTCKMSTCSIFPSIKVYTRVNHAVKEWGYYSEL